MAKAKSKQRTKVEPDSAFLLKLVLYLIIGAQWVRIVNPSLTKEIPLPVGLVAGLLFVMHDHFRIDRKIEIAVLLVAMLIGFWSQTGVYVTLLK